MSWSLYTTDSRDCQPALITHMDLMAFNALYTWPPEARGYDYLGGLTRMRSKGGV